MIRLSQREWSWVMYDFGNSAYALIVMTLFFPLFFREYVVPGGAATSLWGGAVAASTFLAGVAAPLIGAFTDRNSRRKSYFVLFGIIAIAGTMLLSFAADVPWLAGVLLFVLVNTAFGLSLSLYDSFVVVLGRRASTTLSGVGWGVGYVGGLLCLFAIWLLSGGLPESVADYRIWFFFTGVFYFLCSVWPYFSLPMDSKELWVSQDTGMRAISRVLLTLRQWKQFRYIFYFLIAVYLLMDGLSTLVYFIALFAEIELRLTVSQIVELMVIVQVVGLFATIFVCFLAEKLGELNVLLCCGLVWLGLSAAIYFARDFESFRLIAACTGLVVGSTPAIARGYLGKLIPPERRAEFFGFNTLVGRVATLVGPLLYGLAASSWGMRTAILVVVPFFLAGTLMLAFIRFRWGHKLEVSGEL